MANIQKNINAGYSWMGNKRAGGSDELPCITQLCHLYHNGKQINAELIPRSVFHGVLTRAGG
ncbi:hypothetical protein [Undibacterium sp. Ji49W]|uniref:hypothetical protein n=1 Tax=Undibacterium sp. Ji49W TaxID=3413040 RepID=UPI003BF37B00